MGDAMKEASFSLAEAYFAAGDFRFVLKVLNKLDFNKCFWSCVGGVRIVLSIEVLIRWWLIQIWSPSQEYCLDGIFIVVYVLGKSFLTSSLKSLFDF